MLNIRLSRIGKRKESKFRIIIQEKSQATASRFLEQLGFYDPHTEPSTIELQEERIKYWLSQGAQASPTVFNLLVAKKIVEGPPIPLGRPKKKKKLEAEQPKEKEEKKKKEPKQEQEKKSDVTGKNEESKEQKETEQKK